MNILLHDKKIIPKHTYPYIGIHSLDLSRPDPLLILFTSIDSGIVLAINKTTLNMSVGEYDTGFDEGSFDLYDKSITLSN